MIKFNKKYKIIIALVMLLLLLTACITPPPGEQKSIIPATTKVPDKATRDLLSVYNPETGIMRFTNTTDILDSLKTGDVFVGEPSSAAPYGYLRKVNKISREGAEVILETTQAKLTDAIHQGTLNVEGEIKSSQLKQVIPLTEGAYGGLVAESELSPQFEIGKGFKFEAGIEKTFEEEGSDDDLGVDGKVKVTFKGLVKFNVGFRLIVDIGFLADLDSVEASLGFEEEVTLSVVADAVAKMKKEWEVARFDFEPITFFIGPVPVVLVPRATVIVGLDGEASLHFDYTFSQVAAFVQGVRWDEDDGFQKIDRHEFGVKHEGPNLNGQALIKGYSRANMGILLYNIVGPDVGATVGLKLDIAFPRDPLWILYGYVAGDVAFVLNLLGEETRYAEEIFNLEKEIARGEAKPPVVTVLNANPTVDLLFDTDLGQFFNIEDQVGYSYELRSDKDGALSATFLNDKPYSKVKFTSDGPRTLTITAKSVTGKTAQGFFTVNVINTPPETPTLDDESNLTVGEGDEFDLNLKTPNDKNSGVLECASAVRWVVTGTDTLVTENGSSAGCYGTAVFGTQGTRSVKAIITDPQGLTTERDFQITVGPAPAIKSPKIAPIEVNNGEVILQQTVYYTTPLTAVVGVTNPDNVPLTYRWSVINETPAAFVFSDLSASATLSVTAGQEFDLGAFGKHYICGGGIGATPAGSKFKVEITVNGRIRTKVFDFKCVPVPPK